MQWYRKAADQGYAPAQVNLGALYAEGHGVSQDFGEALAWYQSCYQGYALAQFNLGVMCITGQGNLKGLCDGLCLVLPRGHSGR
ncbi:MAG: sel1 repeat family protein [Candidatus Competibacteraceae bacterium]|nr:sel1 repeat family protein [Candidatus Competibacteraceae bacterium]